CEAAKRDRVLRHDSAQRCTWPQLRLQQTPYRQPERRDRSEPVWYGEWIQQEMHAVEAYVLQIEHLRTIGIRSRARRKLALQTEAEERPFGRYSPDTEHVVRSSGLRREDEGLRQRMHRLGHHRIARLGSGIRLNDERGNFGSGVRRRQRYHQ